MCWKEETGHSHYRSSAVYVPEWKEKLAIAIYRFTNLLIAIADSEESW
jgi:hypothetical protein